MMWREWLPYVPVYLLAGMLVFGGRMRAWEQKRREAGRAPVSLRTRLRLAWRGDGITWDRDQLEVQALANWGETDLFKDKVKGEYHLLPKQRVR